MKNNEDKYKQYANDVLSGKIVAGRFIQLACQRYLDWFKRDDIYFNTAKVDNVIKFCSLFKHYEGKSAGTQFKLQPFQEWIIYNIFGWYKKSDNTRVTKRIMIEMARKNGKSFFMSILALYCLIGDGEASPSVQICANSYKQANLLFKMSTTLSSQLDTKHKHFKLYRDSIQFPLNNGFVEVLSSDASKMDGKNSSLFVLDEFHEAQKDDMYNVLLSSQLFRKLTT